MSHALDDVEAKINHAGGYLHSLDAAVRAFHALEPYRAIHEIDPNDGGDVYRAQIAHRPPAALGLLIGDIVHNLRSALDALAFQLALLHTRNPRRATQFPIRLEPPIDKRQIADIIPEAHPVIESLQPYNRGKEAATDTLWVLHELCNIDKHRRINVVGMQSKIPPTVRLIIPGQPDRVVGLDGRIGVFNDGDVLAKLIRAYGNPGIQFKPEFTFRVAFDRGSPAAGRGILDVLLEIHNDIVHRVGPAFLGFFPPRQDASQAGGLGVDVTEGRELDGP